MRFGHKHSRDGVNHVQTHLHTAVSVVRFGLGQAGHTVITVSQDLNPPAMVFLPIRHTKARWEIFKRAHKANKLDVYLKASLIINVTYPPGYTEYYFLHMYTVYV